MKWHLNITPWAVQTEALRKAEGHNKYGWFLEQGLGKSGVSLNEFIEDDDTDINVVIAPQSFKPEWVEAPALYGVDWLPVGMWPRDPIPFQEEIGLYTVNYEAVRSGAYQELKRLFTERKCTLTIDESKAVANYKSATTRAVMELSKYAIKIRELNGTPMTENIMDWYSQLRILGEFNGWNPVAFRRRYALTGGYMGRQIIGINPDREEELAKVIDKCSFRALKKDWRKDLPPQINVPMRLEMTNNQLTHYRTMCEEFYLLVNNNQITASMVLVQREKLRQISSCMVMDQNKAHWIEPHNKNPKIKAVIDLLNIGQKTIVAYYYKSSGEALLDVLTKAGFNPACIYGGMKSEIITEEKRRFNSDPACRVLVGQITATARGHTLVGLLGDRCSHIVFYENHFGLYWREQMKDRNHRADQDSTCYLYDLITSPMDQVVVDCLVRKKNDADLMDEIVETVRRRGW